MVDVLSCAQGRRTPPMPPTESGSPVPFASSASESDRRQARAERFNSNTLDFMEDLGISRSQGSSALASAHGDQALAVETPGRLRSSRLPLRCHPLRLPLRRPYRRRRVCSRLLPWAGPSALGSPSMHRTLTRTRRPHLCRIRRTVRTRLRRIRRTVRMASPVGGPRNEREPTRWTSTPAVKVKATTAAWDLSSVLSRQAVRRRGSG